MQVSAPALRGCHAAKRSDRLGYSFSDCAKFPPGTSSPLGISLRSGAISSAARFSALQFTTWALIRFVVPLALRGTPAVMTTVSPLWTSPSFRAVSTQREKSRSVESTEP